VQSRSGRADRCRGEVWQPGWVDDLPEYPNARLNDEIITRRGAREVLALWGARGPEFNHVNAVTALHRIARARDGAAAVGDEGLERLVAGVAEQLARISSGRAADAR